ncbi:subtilisin-like protein [Mytilinidion resinicola]|uniref:Subtilisin-like protein n=1 Tax=Mytilinidion resinicola TaxID=574789 RepID=A0A6A6Y137_9PEZI|nr:subtilisin-like protein [Mytilinidion resinicola]KAF2802521.1 subtilisin-like protein [Mytilinidion resinicola]
MRIPHEDPQDPQRLRARLLNNLKALIFRSHRDVGSLELALYKDGDKRKLLELDLSDFDVLGSEAQRCDFTHFVKNFSRPSEGLDFESTLASVQLPDISQARDRKLHQEVIDLLTKLRRPFGVEKIVSLTVWDNPFHPMSDLVIAESVRLYQIEELNWCKLDLDLDVLKNRATSLRKLCLYSSGNWGILYHWLSPEGLASTEHFRNGDRASDAHLTRLEHLAERTRRIYGRSGSRSIKFVVTVDLPHRLESSTIPVENEGSSDRFFRSFSTIHKTLDSPQTQNLSRSCQPANRIKIAIIDNGVDKWQTTISENIKKGISYMSKTHGHTLPWFTASHAHGTHMASLIRKVSPICDLYIYRVNSHRGDINAENVIKAIKDASREKVDIVNLSLTFDKNPPGLEDAINAAATREKDKALFFCATSDEPHHSGKVYPAHSPNTISVSAANRGGRRRMESKGDVDLLVLGENMAVEGPTYFTKPQGVASGSSVATALASGIASVLLVCAMRVCAKEGGDWEEFKRRDKMLMLFKEMQPDEKHKYIDPALLFQRKLQQNGEAWWHIFNPQRYP